MWFDWGWGLVVRSRQAGFALPTILIAGVVMLIVILSAIQGAVSITVAIDNNYYQHLADEAATSGVAFAQACHEIGQTWSQPLTPGTDCNGNQRAGCSLGQSCNFLLKQGFISSAFSVAPPVASGTSFRFDISSSVSLYRSADNTVWRTYNSSRVHLISYSVLSPIKAGNRSTCAIAHGKLFCWGDNQAAQSGNPGNLSAVQSTPYKVVFPAPIQYAYDVVAGFSHTCALVGTTPTPTVNDSRIYCWGFNGFGQFGDGTQQTWPTVTRSPVLVWGPDATRAFTKISGRNNTCVVLEANPGIASGNKNVRCWGDNDRGQSGDNATGGAAYGDGTTTYGSLLNPKLNPGTYNIKDAATAVDLPSVVGLTAVTLDTGCAISIVSSSRVISCWGSNAQGQFGDGSPGMWYTRAKQANTLTEAQIVSNNNRHACALNGNVSTNRRLYCWGANGINGTPDYRTDAVAIVQSNTPVAMDTGAGASAAINTRTTTTYMVDFGLADAAACILQNTGKIYCWGYNDRGQLGQGAADGPAYMAGVTPTITGSGSTQRPLAAAYAVEVRGYNDELVGQKFTSIGAGYGHFCAITDRDVTYCWGYNEHGELGIGTTSASSACRCEPWPQRVNIVDNSLTF